MRTRSRRTCHVVPGSSEQFLAKARCASLDKPFAKGDLLAAVIALLAA